MKRIAVIGAGVAGLAAAKLLVRYGFDVTLYEKSRGVGGRVVTRYVNGCRFDHGAQVVKTPSTRLLQLVTTGVVDGLAGAYNISRPVWTFDADNTVAEGNPVQNADPKWTWTGGAVTLSRAMAAGLHIHYGARVHNIAATPRCYILHNAEGHALCEAEAVLLTPPAPQAAELIAESSIAQDLQETLLRLLTQVSYRRCLSVALAYARRPSVPWYALVNSDRRHALAWLGCEHDKPEHAPATLGLMIAQMSTDFSITHWDDAEKGTYGEHGSTLPPYMLEIHDYVQTLVGDDLGRPLWANLQRWRYSQPNIDSSATFDSLNSTESGIYFAGDYIEGIGRVHQAIECGWRVAEQICTDIDR